MLAEIFGIDGVIVLLIPVTLGLVIWSIVDVALGPTLSSGAKTSWILGFIGATLIIGIGGLIVSLVYLVGIRPPLEPNN